LGPFARIYSIADKTLCRYLPAIGRFLIVVTFLEDALRIITQWSDQLLYLNDYRHSKSGIDSMARASLTDIQFHPASPISSSSSTSSP
jgi:hypothetical protein